MECKKMVLKPKNKLVRTILSSDKCPHFKNIKGVHISYGGRGIEFCPFAKICKYYEKKIKQGDDK